MTTDRASNRGMKVAWIALGIFSLVGIASSYLLPGLACAMSLFAALILVLVFRALQRKSQLLFVVCAIFAVVVVGVMSISMSVEEAKKAELAEKKAAEASAAQAHQAALLAAPKAARRLEASIKRSTDAVTKEDYQRAITAQEEARAIAEKLERLKSESGSAASAVEAFAAFESRHAMALNGVRAVLAAEKQLEKTYDSAVDEHYDLGVAIDGLKESKPPQRYKKQARQLSRKLLQRRKKIARKADREAKDAIWNAKCGETPPPTATTKLMLSLTFKQAAHDPDSIDVVGCESEHIKTRKQCWQTKCAIRGRNTFGASRVNTYKVWVGREGKVLGWK